MGMSGDRIEATRTPGNARARRLLKFAIAASLVVTFALWWVDKASENIGRGMLSALPAGNGTAQVKQALQHEGEKPGKPAGDSATDLAQLKQAMQQDRERAEKLTGELAVDLAQVKQALQQERDKTEKLTRALTTDL